MSKTHRHASFSVSYMVISRSRSRDLRHFPYRHKTSLHGALSRTLRSATVPHTSLNGQASHHGRYLVTTNLTTTAATQPSVNHNLSVYSLPFPVPFSPSSLTTPPLPFPQQQRHLHLGFCIDNSTILQLLYSTWCLFRRNPLHRIPALSCQAPFPPATHSVPLRVINLNLVDAPPHDALIRSLNSQSVEDISRIHHTERNTSLPDVARRSGWPDRAATRHTPHASRLYWLIAPSR